MGYKLGSNKNNNSFTSFQDKGLIKPGNGNGDPPYDQIIGPGENKFITNKLKEANFNYNKKMKELNKNISVQNPSHPDYNRYKNTGGINMTSAPHEWLLAGGPIKSSFNLAKSTSGYIKNKITNFATSKTTSAGFQLEVASSIGN